MSLPEFFAAFYGWKAAHANGGSSDNPPPPTIEEYKQIIERFGP
jgi:hypothetical protein